MPQVFNSFFNSVEGNEGDLCKYPVRLDTYGCGCQHNCGYCYARSLLAFRGMWNAQSPAKAPISEIRKVVARKLRPGQVVRLGGMTDCFQPMERSAKVTYRTIQMLNARRVHYLVVTKNDLVATDPYLEVMDRDLAHVQVSITTTDADLSRRVEPGAPVPEQRIAAAERLQAEGFDVAVRLSPFIHEFVDLDIINAIRCDKILVEFLRVNTWIEKWLQGLPVDLAPYTHFNAGYKHLPLTMKRRLIQRVTGFREVTVCEDVPQHHQWWRENVNANPDDCCNLYINR